MPEEPLTLLQQIEREVLAEAEEFARKRLAERLQELADAHGEVSPLSQRPLVRRKQRRLVVRSVAGDVEIMAAYGQDPTDKSWHCPTRQLLGLSSRQRISPELEQRLCFTATQSLSYEAASQTAEVWGTKAAPSTIHKVVQRVGRRTRQVQATEVERALEVGTRAQVIAEAAQSAPAQPFSLVLMIDGWMIRERGEAWGLKPVELAGKRVQWHEEKTGIVFRLQDRAETQSARRLIIEKQTEACRTDAYEFGRRFYALALRCGLAQAQTVYVVADGGVWIWNLFADRFGDARPLLDFYHASQHLWAVAHALHPQDEQAAGAWVRPLLHQLKHGGEAGVLQGLKDLTALLETLDEESHQTIVREQNFFDDHREHLGYARMAERGGPIGSGAMESTCAQLQDRFKRTGQFWVLDGHSNLMALDLARRNKKWNRIWAPARSSLA